ncbi:hypothetical protein THASP1DRAFT_33007 [Thamnocephalis sphaerospora]|uniref:Selenoprotein O n=1 Tax=Thamnocephalis sphaerospora TaxID=78915 RepID=A0A4P9XHK3_9FUNG|nr:hypothetical protein THASP1DRAFT_33007 [Thamnocephalis sphaerospora]|eukprot:RKP05152.1 hypothetical protein THASP1DRAFT_33007 [Thamnocephalis sphaerospora]
MTDKAATPTTASTRSTVNLNQLRPADTFTRALPGDTALSNSAKLFPEGAAPDTDGPVYNASLAEKLMRTARQVPDACWSYVRPEQQPNARLIGVSDSALQLVGLSAADAAANRTEYADVFSGNRLLPGSRPWAHRYGGHQFGYYAGQLGDGRAVSLGKCARWELQLKGSGKTPYSRFADGYAVYRSSIREFLCSEAMHALGVPTSRALTLVRTSREVLRETTEPGAVVCRAAPSWVRFGSFEVHYYRREWRALRALADHVIRYHYPELLVKDTALEEGKHNVYARWFQEVVRRTAHMVAAWQAVGYCHGVMNTDNMSILGITIDYGPFGFLDEYDPTWICNHSDTEASDLRRKAGRYSFENQPSIAAWNLACLARCLLHLMAPDAPVTVRPVEGADGAVEPAMFDESLLGEGDATPPATVEDTASDAWKERVKAGTAIADEILSSFKDTFMDAYADRMRPKLGLQTAQPDDLNVLVIPLLALLYHSRVDYTRFMRDLSNTPLDQVEQVLPKHAEKTTPDLEDGWKAWCAAYTDRVRAEYGTTTEGLAGQDDARQQQMRTANPKFVLRNWIAQECIQRAELGDDECVAELLQLVGTDRAFEEGDRMNQRYAGKVPEWGRGIQCSCSS